MQVAKVKLSHYSMGQYCISNVKTDNQKSNFPNFSVNAQHKKDSHNIKPGILLVVLNIPLLAAIQEVPYYVSYNTENKLNTFKFHDIQLLTIVFSDGSRFSVSLCHLPLLLVHECCHTKLLVLICNRKVVTPLHVILFFEHVSKKPFNDCATPWLT